MATLTVEYSAPRKNGERKIYVILSQHCKRKRLDTKIIVWPHEYKKTRTGAKLSPSKQNMLDKVMQKYRERIYECEANHMGTYISIDLILSYINGERDRQGDPDFFAFADQWLAASNIKGEKNYRSMLNSLERHLGVRRLPFRDINYAMLDRYSRSLADRPRAQSLYLGEIRHLHKEARLRYNTDEHTLISPTVFERFKTPKQRLIGQRSVDLQTLRSIIAYEGRGRAQTARDCFVLSFLLMGMNSADMFDADARIVDNKICYHRKKTRDRRSDSAYIEVVIPEEAMPLMEKYRGYDRVFRFSEMYSTETELNRNINIGLKTVQKDLGLDITLQFYQARHTWASIARNECGVDAYTVDKALNHLNKELQLLDVYVRRDFAAVNAANRKVIDYVLHDN